MGWNSRAPIAGIWLGETSSTSSRFSMTVRIRPMFLSFAARRPIYEGIRQLANSPGMDGTVRWAGAGLNIRKIIPDLTRAATRHVSVEKWMGTNVPVYLMVGLNHGTIIAEPTDELVSLVKKALLVDNADKFRSWLTATNAHGRGVAVAAEKGAWQQVVVRCVDQRDDPIRDFQIQLFEGDQSIPDFDDEHVAVCSRDHSYRCFLFDVDKLLAPSSLTV